MLNVPGTSIPSEEIGDLAPDEVLYDLDGPRIFTTRDRRNNMLLAYLYAERGPQSSYFVVPFSKRDLARLQSGKSAMLDALSQPWIWDVDVEYGRSGQTIKGCSKIDFDDIPSDVLPVAGTMLWAHLQPLFTLRFSGQDAEQGNVAPEVITKLVKAATSAVSVLGGYVRKRRYEFSEALEGVFQLRASRFAFRSFEIDFRESNLAPAPAPPGQPASTEGDGGDIDRVKSEAIGEMGELLSRGLEWANESGSDERAIDAFRDEEERRTVLDAVQRITSVISSTVSEVEVGGRLLANYSGKTRGAGAVVLDSEAKIRVSVGIGGPPEKKKDPEAVWIEGRPAVSDKDKKSFVLRDIEGPRAQWVCRYPPELHHDVMGFYSSDARVKVFGVPMDKIFRVEKIEPIAVQVGPLSNPK